MDSAPSSPRDTDSLAALLIHRAPSLGPVRLVAVDGHAGSGKTTFAARLSAALGRRAQLRGWGDAPVVHLDDLACHDALFGWTDRLQEQVLAPLEQGRTARFAVYDWERRRFGPGEAVVPAAPVVLLEGVGAGRRALRPLLSCLVWMDVPAAAAHRRGLRRDGEELTEFWESWRPAEERHFAGDPSAPYAHFVVCDRNAGQVVRKGPVGLT